MPQVTKLTYEQRAVLCTFVWEHIIIEEAAPLAENRRVSYKSGHTDASIADLWNHMRAKAAGFTASRADVEKVRAEWIGRRQFRRKASEIEADTRQAEMLEAELAKPKQTDIVEEVKRDEEEQATAKHITEQLSKIFGNLPPKTDTTQQTLRELARQVGELVDAADEHKDHIHGIRLDMSQIVSRIRDCEERLDHYSKTIGELDDRINHLSTRVSSMDHLYKVMLSRLQSLEDHVTKPPADADTAAKYS